MLNNVIQNLYQGQIQSLQLTQIEGHKPIESFIDSSGKEWKLVKACSDSSSDVPSINSVSLTDYWNHEVEGANPKIYIYVVEGIKQPKNEKEVPCSIMYVWFSTVNNMSFNPNMISASEWLMANVYAGNLTDTRISKLAYLTENIVKKEQNIQRPALIKLDETTKTKSKKE